MKRQQKITPPEWKGIIGIPLTPFSSTNELDLGP